MFIICLMGCETTNSKPNNKNEKVVFVRMTGYWAKGNGSDYNTRHLNCSFLGKGKLKPGHCAVDPKIIPYGSQITYPSGEIDTAVDTGSAVVSRKAARRTGTTKEEKGALVVDKFFITKVAACKWISNNPLFMWVKIIFPWTQLP